MPPCPWLLFLYSSRLLASSSCHPTQKVSRAIRVLADEYFLSLKTTSHVVQTQLIQRRRTRKRGKIALDGRQSTLSLMQANTVCYTRPLLQAYVNDRVSPAQRRGRILDMVSERLRGLTASIEIWTLPKLSKQHPAMP